MNEITEDSDFDENEDPDNIPVPGGLNTPVSSKPTFTDWTNTQCKEMVCKTTSTDMTAKKKFVVFDMKTKKIVQVLNRGYQEDKSSKSKKVASNVTSSDMTRTKEIEVSGSKGPLKKIPFLINAEAVRYSTARGLPLIQQPRNVQQIAESIHQQEEEEVDDEELGVAETYSDYMPSKLKLGIKHPDPVVETASLSSVAPADVWYKLSLPENTIRTGALSALQLESITYVSQAHEHILPDGTRAGFFIGDGAGVGKGRTIAGIIFENYLNGRKRAVWVSVSNDLKYDCQRDLTDIGANMIEVHSLSKFKYDKISSTINGNVKNGVIFSTYAALISESTSAVGIYRSRLKQLLQWCGEDFEGLIIFDECHKAKNLSSAGSTKPTKTGLTVLELQKKLPKARVVYASATGASEPKHMAYMVRLGLWGTGTPFRTSLDFISTVEKRGIGAMEIVAMDMKLRGMYIARQLSFQGVSFKIEEVRLTKEFLKMYDASVKLWVEAMHLFEEGANLIDAGNNLRKTMWGQFWSAHQRFFKYLCIAAKVPYVVNLSREAIKCGKCVVIGLQSTGEARTVENLERNHGELTNFVSTAKGVFQSLVENYFPAINKSRTTALLEELPSAFSKHTSNDLNESKTSYSRKRKQEQQSNLKVKRNRIFISGNDSDKSNDSSPEISDHEGSFTDSTSDSDFNPFKSDSDYSDTEPWERIRKRKKSRSLMKKTSASKGVQNILMEQNNQDKSEAFLHFKNFPQNAMNETSSMKAELLAKIEKLGKTLPMNTLDELIDELGGTENVAEMTGRKGRVIQTENGDIKYESRSEEDISIETINLAEKQRFMNKEKDVAIISEAASSGISLQSDRRVKNQRRRVHITLELPWSADRAIQQFGRTHRSNQVNAPEYIFLISNLAGERRFASTVAKRLESMGALTHGDRRATETRDLSQFNIDNKYGRWALEATMKAIIGSGLPLVPPPIDYKGDFFKDVAAALVGVGLIVRNESSPNKLTLDKDYSNISKFLNRILGMPVDLQNRLFSYFTDTLNATMARAKRSGNLDLGILDLGTGNEVVKLVRTITFLRKHATGRAPTELQTVHVERGMSWPEALDKFSESAINEEGFYVSHQKWNGKNKILLAVCVNILYNFESSRDRMFSLYSPNTGLQIKQQSLKNLEKKYKKVESSEAEHIWSDQYDSSVSMCSHMYWHGRCRTILVGQDCEIGLRKRTYNIVAGSVLSIWDQVENVLMKKKHKLQVIRLRTRDNLKIVGTLIPKNCVDEVTALLASDAEKLDEQIFT